MFQHFDKFLKVEELIRSASPQLVVELGAGSGHNTRLLAPLCEELGSLFVVISDGRPPVDLPGVEWRWAISYLALQSFPDDSIDVALVDTDHNSWTLEQEMRVLLNKVRAGGLVLIHDTASFADNNGYMLGYGSGDPYRLEEMQKDQRTYAEAVRSWIGRGFEVVRESRDSAGAIALRRTN